MMRKKHCFQEVLATLSIIALLKNSNYEVFPWSLSIRLNRVNIGVRCGRLEGDVANIELARERSGKTAHA